MRYKTKELIKKYVIIFIIIGITTTVNLFLIPFFTNKDCSLNQNNVNICWPYQNTVDDQYSYLKNNDDKIKESLRSSDCEGECLTNKFQGYFNMRLENATDFEETLQNENLNRNEFLEEKYDEYLNDL
jgi:regulatory protein YycI of two-component signal transduction system YycFG